MQKNSLYIRYLVPLAFVLSPLAAYGEKLTYQDFLKRVASQHPERQIDEKDINVVSNEMMKVGRLPDPRISISRERIPFSSMEGKTQSEWNLSLSQSFPWPGTLGAESEAARLKLDARKLSIEEATLLRQLEATELLIQLASLDEKIAIERESLKDAKAIAQYSAARLSQGLGSHLDALQAQNDFEVLNSNIEVLENSRKNLFDAAALLIGKSRNEIELIGSLESIEKSTGLFEDSSSADFALQFLEIQKKSEIAKLETERKRSLPEFMTSAMVMKNDAGMTMYGVMLGVRIPIFSMGTRSAIERESLSTIEKKSLQVEWQARKKKIALDQNLRAIEQIERQIRLLGTSLVPNTKSHLNTALNEYSEGQGNVKQVIDTRKALLALSNTEVDLRVSLLQAKLNVAKASSGFVDGVLNPMIPEIPNPSISSDMPSMGNMKSKSSMKMKSQKTNQKKIKDAPEDLPSSGGMGGMGGM